MQNDEENDLKYLAFPDMFNFFGIKYLNRSKLISV